MKPAFFLLLASILVMILTESLWFAPVVAWFAALTIRDLLNLLPPPPPMGELGMNNDEEVDKLSAGIARFRKALHD